MNKLSLLGSCQQVVMINQSAIKSHVKKPNLRIVSNNHGKTIRLLTVPFTLVLFPKETLSCFLNNFESPPLRLSIVRLRYSQFSQNISQVFQHFAAKCHYRRFTVVIYLSSFVEGSETTEPCHLYRVKNCYNVLFDSL